MKRLLQVAALAALGLVFAASMAQRNWTPDEYHHDYKPLLKPTGKKFLDRADVRAELRITDQQLMRMKALKDEKKAAERQLRAQGLPRDQYEQRKQALERQYDPRQVLTAQQRTRLQQLELQWNGAISLVNPAVARQLGLSAQQQARIREIAARGAAETHNATRGQPKHEKKIAEAQLRERVNQQILSVLTPQQRAQWQRMLGTPFQFSERK